MFKRLGLAVMTMAGLATIAAAYVVNMRASSVCFDIFWWLKR